MYKVIGEKLQVNQTPPASKKDMKDELKNFLKEQMKSEQGYNSIQQAPQPFM
jgi:hypothetical protein